METEIIPLSEFNSRLSKLGDEIEVPKDLWNIAEDMKVYDIFEISGEHHEQT